MWKTLNCIQSIYSEKWGERLQQKLRHIRCTKHQQKVTKYQQVLPQIMISWVDSKYVNISSVLDVICCTTDVWRYDSFQIWELPEKLSSRAFMLDVHYNRIIALHQTHILIFQFGHYVWRLFEGEVPLIWLKRECRRWNCLRRNHCNVLVHDFRNCESQNLSIK